MKQEIKNFFIKYTKDNSNIHVNSIKPMDLAVQFIYKDIKEDKPFAITKNNRIQYYIYFHAIDNRGNVLHTIKATDKHTAREKLEKNINKYTKKYKDWKDSGFSIKYNGDLNDIQAILIKDMKSKFPHIEEHFKWYAEICEEFENLLPNKKRR